MTITDFKSKVAKFISDEKKNHRENLKEIELAEIADRWKIREEKIKGRTAANLLNGDYSLGVANQAQTRQGYSRPVVNFSGVRISTGERALLDVNDKCGAFKRVLNIRADKLFSDSFAANLHIFTANNYGHFGRDWINFIIEHKSEIRADFFKLIEDVHSAEIFHGEPTHLKNLIACFVAYENFIKTFPSKKSPTKFFCRRFLLQILFHY